MPPDNYGNLLLPAQIPTDDQTPGDPLLDVLLDFFRAVINRTGQGAWSNVSNDAAQLPVQFTFAADPLRGNLVNSKLPALYMYRAYNNPSAWIAQDYFVRTSGLVMYWIPPRVARQDQRARVQSFYNIIQSACDNILEPIARDPSWVRADDTDPRAPDEGSLLWRYAKIWAMDMGRSEWVDLALPTDTTGMDAGTKTPAYPAVKTIIDLQERNQGELPEDYLAISNVTGSVLTGDGTLDYIDYSFQLTFASISPTSGPVAGGTSLVIHGTGFAANGCTVVIGGNACTNVLVSAPGVLTATTGASLTAGARNVVITNPSGETVTAPLAYTYT